MMTRLIYYKTPPGRMASQSSTAINYGVHKMASKRKLKIQIKGAKEKKNDQIPPAAWPVSVAWLDALTHSPDRRLSGQHKSLTYIFTTHTRGILLPTTINGGPLAYLPLVSLFSSFDPRRPSSPRCWACQGYKVPLCCLLPYYSAVSSSLYISPPPISLPFFFLFFYFVLQPETPTSIWHTRRTRMLFEII